MTLFLGICNFAAVIPIFKAEQSYWSSVHEAFPEPNHKPKLLTAEMEHFEDYFFKTGSDSFKDTKGYTGKNWYKTNKLSVLNCLIA